MLYNDSTGRVTYKEKDNQDDRADIYRGLTNSEAMIPKLVSNASAPSKKLDLGHPSCFVLLIAWIGAIYCLQYTILEYTVINGNEPATPGHLV